MIILSVSRDELLIGEIGDSCRKSARFKAVAGIGEQSSHEFRFHAAVHRGKSAFHLVEHNALVYGSIGAAAHFDMPALLIEYIGVIVYSGSEYRVQIYPCKVHKVRIVPAGYGENCLVGIGHGIEEGIHRTLHKLKEGLLHGVFLRAAENGVLEDMEYTRIICGGSPEGCGEQLVLPVVSEPDQFCACPVMLHFYELRAAVGGGSCSCNGKAVYIVVYLHLIPPDLVIENTFIIPFRRDLCKRSFPRTTKKLPQGVNLRREGCDFMLLSGEFLLILNL